MAGQVCRRSGLQVLWAWAWAIVWVCRPLSFERQLPLASVNAGFEERFLMWREAAKQRPVPNRPPYIACTEAASVRAATCRRLLRIWPGGPVEDFRCVVGGLSGFDSLEALAKAQVGVRRVTLFDINETQLLYGELILELLCLASSRDAFLASLFGRSERKFSRVLGASNMMDFLDLPVDRDIESSIVCQLPAKLQGLYRTVFTCISTPCGWPVAWPSFGQHELLPKRRNCVASLTKSQRRLGGQKNEAFHINECGWLREEMSYCRLRALLMDLRASGSLSFQRMNLKDMHPTDGPTVLFISNIDGSPQFLDELALANLRQGLSRGHGGTLLLSTRRAEWLAEDSSSSGG
ncbi:Pol [Symbiodinium microadriaticum]|nr:Pol [Symbiodinium microadriaticum]